MKAMLHFRLIKRNKYLWRFWLMNGRFLFDRNCNNLHEIVVIVGNNCFAYFLRAYTVL